ncbi:MAG: 50S ribosomal protein L24 [Bacteroidetes bacterium]|nr:MAG: 50S ribosomal protein L24 [Bacteroidota bacterium]
MASKIHIKKGDTVMVITGESKGMQGRVLVVDPKAYKAIVEGANQVSKHTKPNADNPKGGILKKEAFIHISNLKLVDGKGNATRIKREIDEKTNKTVRVSKKSGEVIK